MLRPLALLILACIVGCGSMPSSAGTDGTIVDAGPVSQGHLTSPNERPRSMESGTSDSGPNGTPSLGRDWKTHPAIVDVPAPATLYALSDVHGGYARLLALLLANGVISTTPPKPSDAHWTAGAATLVVTGDMVDKGPESLEVLDFLMTLQDDAKNGGGIVIVTLGNHEAEFLVDPTNSKASAAKGIGAELKTHGILPVTLASAGDPRGAWLRQLPFGARVGGWFFSHAGDSNGRTLSALESTLEAAVDAHADYDDPEIVGPSSILESRNWYATSAIVQRNAAALGVNHIVFGHDPSALGSHDKIAIGANNMLIRIDCGMSPDVDYSTGMLLRVTQQGNTDVIEQLDAKGKIRSLFTSAR